MTRAEQSYRDDVAGLGCIACLIDGNPGTSAELHHCRILGGKRDLAPLLPICPAHHRGGYAGVISIHKSKAKFRERYGSEADLVEMVERLVSERRQRLVGGVRC